VKFVQLEILRFII